MRGLDEHASRQRAVRAATIIALLACAPACASASKQSRSASTATTDCDPHGHGAATGTPDRCQVYDATLPLRREAARCSTTRSSVSMDFLFASDGSIREIKALPIDAPLSSTTTNDEATLACVTRVTSRVKLPAFRAAQFRLIFQFRVGEPIRY